MLEKTIQGHKDSKGSILCDDQVQFAPLVFCPTCGLVLMDGADGCDSCNGGVWL